MPSTASPSDTCKMRSLPENVSAASAAAPPNCVFSVLMSSVRFLDFFVVSSIGIPSRLSAVMLPVNARPSASETDSKSFPVAAEISNARPSWFCANETSPVARTSAAIAGRSASSVTPVSIICFEMCCSTAAICSVVALVVRLSWSASFFWLS